MSTAPNIRNGNLAPDGPNLSSDDLYEYAVIVCIDDDEGRSEWDGWAWRREHGSGINGWEGIDLSTIASNVMALPISDSDAHYVLTGCSDAQYRFWCRGNQHNDGHRTVVFPDHTADWTNPANWEDAEPYFDVLDTTGNTATQAFSYSTFIPLPDGTLLLKVSQNDRVSSPYVLGRDVMLLELGPNDDEWQIGRGTVDGHFAITDETDEASGDPERAYMVGVCVSPEGRIGWFGSWMDGYNDNWRKWLYYVEWDPDTEQWQTIDGTPVTLPLSYNETNATSTYSNCQVTSSFTDITISAYPAFDQNGYPSIVVQESITNNRRRVYWDGNSWEYDSGTKGGQFLLKNELWYTLWDSGTTARMRPTSINSPVSLSGQCAAKFDPHPDPRRLWQGEGAFLVPNGNKPVVASFGRGYPLGDLVVEDDGGDPDFYDWWPDETNTGTSGTLTPSGVITTSSNGQIIENLDITGHIFVEHDDVIIRNCKITSDGGNAIYILNHTGLLIEDCELDGQDNNAEAAVSEHNYTIRRCNIHNYAEGLRANGNVTVEDNYMHTFSDFIALGAHQDAFQATSGDNHIVRHNTIHNHIDGANGAIFFSTYGGDGVLIEHNIADSGGYCINVAVGPYTNVVVRYNWLDTHVYPNAGGNYAFGDLTGALRYGNRWLNGPNDGELIDGDSPGPP